MHPNAKRNCVPRNDCVMKLQAYEGSLDPLNISEGNWNSMTEGMFPAGVYQRRFWLQKSCCLWVTLFHGSIEEIDQALFPVHSIRADAVNEVMSTKECCCSLKR